MQVNIMPGLGLTNAICTDGSYIYVHSSKGISKIGMFYPKNPFCLIIFGITGTGLNGTSPGFIAGQIKGYRGLFYYFFETHEEILVWKS